MNRFFNTPVLWKRYAFLMSSGALLLLWGVISLISWNHLERNYDWLNLPTVTIGWLWWCMALIAIIYIGRRYLNEVLFVSLFFFIIGFFLGPYLEPPADPLEHIRRVYSYCGQHSYDIPRQNRGLWHYSMSGVFLCNANFTHTPELTLRTIDFLYGMYLALVITALFLIGKSAGLSGRWSFFGALTGFLFFGTNKFSFFSYYALAASFSSMLIYWLWTSAFFFRTHWKQVIFGMLFALLAVPVMWVNHIQEAAFLGLALSVWLFLNTHKWLWHKLRYSISLFNFPPLNIGKSFYIAALLVAGFVITQYPSFMVWLDSEEWLRWVYYRWETNQYLLTELFPHFKLGNFIDYRVWDSLGGIGFLPLLLAVPLLWSTLLSLSLTKRLRIVLLSSLPFLVFFIPLLSFFWVSSLQAAVAELIYWRIIYSSLFWLALAALLFGIEQKLPYALNFIQGRLQSNSIFPVRFSLSQKSRLNWMERLWFGTCLMILVILSGISSSPIYGKLDFILLDSRPWWPEWKTMIEQIDSENKVINTDRVTSTVLHNVFNYSSVHDGSSRPMNVHDGEMNISKMRLKNEYTCLINLRGFSESWVPTLTGHWQPTIAHTARRYQFEGENGEVLSDKLMPQDANNCFIFK